MTSVAGSATPRPPNGVYTIKNFQSMNGDMMGMFAAKDIEAGEIILIDEALIFAKSGPDARSIYNGYKAADDKFRERYIKLTYAWPEQVKDFNKQLKRDANDKAGKIVAIFETNCMVTRDGSLRYLCLEAARMNHSCWPNATYDFDEADRTIAVRALEKIPKDAEILIPYVSVLSSRKVRDEILWDQYHFVCTCRRCPRPGGTDPLLSEKTRDMLEKAEAKLQAIRERAVNNKLHPSSTDVVEQMALCKFFFERAVSLKPVMPNALHKLNIYLPMLKEQDDWRKMEDAKKWFSEGYRLGRICHGENDSYVKQFWNDLKEF